MGSSMPTQSLDVRLNLKLISLTVLNLMPLTHALATPQYRPLQSSMALCSLSIFAIFSYAILFGAVSIVISCWRMSRPRWYASSASSTAGWSCPPAASSTMGASSSGMLCITQRLCRQNTAVMIWHAWNKAWHETKTWHDMKRSFAKLTSDFT